MDVCTRMLPHTPSFPSSLSSGASHKQQKKKVDKAADKVSQNREEVEEALFEL